MTSVVSSIRAKLDSTSGKRLTGVAAGVAAAGVTLYLAYRTFSSHHGSFSAAPTEAQAALTPSASSASAKDDLPRAVELLVAAHASSPALKALTPKGASAATVSAGLTRLYTALLRCTLPTSFQCVVLLTSDAVAVWAPPGVSLDADAFAFHGGRAAGTTLCGWGNERRLEGLLSNLAARTQRLTGGKGYTLLAGASRSPEALDAVVKPVLARADAEHVAVAYAGVNPELAKALQARFGFLQEEDFTYFGAEMSVMLRAEA